jgi:hypothetical protein
MFLRYFPHVLFQELEKLRKASEARVPHDPTIFLCGADPTTVPGRKLLLDYDWGQMKENYNIFK